MRPLERIDLSRLQAVIFDMDGVLVDSMPFHATAWIRVLREIGVSVSREEIYAREGESGTAAVRFFLRQHGRELSPEATRELLVKKEGIFKHLGRVEPFPGARDLVRALQALGKRLAIVTGTAREELQSLLPPDLLAFFDVLVTGDQVKHGKPDPEPYLTALEKLGVEARQALVVENAPLGIQSAKSAGILCLAVETSLQCPQLSGADGCFADMQDLARFLLR